MVARITDLIEYWTKRTMRCANQTMNLVQAISLPYLVSPLLLLLPVETALGTSKGLSILIQPEYLTVAAVFYFAELRHISRATQRSIGYVIAVSNS